MRTERGIDGALRGRATAPPLPETPSSQDGMRGQGDLTPSELDKRIAEVIRLMERRARSAPGWDFS